MQQPFNIGKIGADRTVQDPQKAFEAAEGRYKDEVEGMSDQQRLPMLPKAPDPSPFSIRR